MDDEPEHQSNHDSGLPSPSSFSQDLKYSSVSALVPEDIRLGVIATGVLIVQAREEFAIDFLSAMAQPQQLVARVIVTVSTFRAMIRGLEANIAKYEEQFGLLLPHQPVASPTTQTLGGALDSLADSFPGTSEAMASATDQQSDSTVQPEIGDLYEQLKPSTKMLAGAYANTVILRHSPEEFCFDFIAHFYPRSVVTSRVYMAAGRVPSLVRTMANSLQKYQEKVDANQQPPRNPPSDT